MELPLFRCAFLAYLKKCFKEKKLSNNGVDTNTDTDTAEERTAEKQTAE
jgi:hypothetical protein